MSVTTPDWVKDAVFYQIFPDRFARSEHLHRAGLQMEDWNSPPNSYGFKGGDLIGVTEKLDYLQDLGITAIYFNPIFSSAANHRYHTYDYTNVDPILGGDAALRRLLDEAHRRDIRVIIDGVFNHASRGFYQFNHLLENGPASPYLDWFQVQGWPLHAYEGHISPNYAAWWNLHALPKLNIQTPAVREFLLGVAQHWIEQGADGWRLDVPNEIDDDEFWREFRRRVKDANPEAYIVGEIWDDSRRWLQGDQFDAVALGVEHDALEVAVARAARSVKHGDALGAQAFGELADRGFGAKRDGQVGEADALRPGFELGGGERGRRHHLDARTGPEAQEAGREALALVAVQRSGLGTEVGAVEVAHPLQVPHPEGDVLDAGHLAGPLSAAPAAAGLPRASTTRSRARAPRRGCRRRPSSPVRRRARGRARYRGPPRCARTAGRA